MAGSLGQVSFIVKEDNKSHERYLMIEDNQPSSGYHHIKPNEVAKKFDEWIHHVHEHVIEIAKEHNIKAVYASTANRMRKIYSGLSQGDAKRYYVRLYRDDPHWQKIDTPEFMHHIFPNSDQYVWQYSDLSRDVLWWVSVRDAETDHCGSRRAFLTRME